MFAKYFVDKTCKQQYIGSVDVTRMRQAIGKSLPAAEMMPGTWRQPSPGMNTKRFEIPPFEYRIPQIVRKVNNKI
jgi:hypothetical protein